MTQVAQIPFEADQLLDWATIANAIQTGHEYPRALVTDNVLRRKIDTMLMRTAWIDGLGQAVKTATIFPNNSDHPSINGGVMLFDDTNGTLKAIVDFHLITKWKTVADSLLAASLLARQNSKELLIIGAGTVAENLIDAYRTQFPNINITIWNRTTERAGKLAKLKNTNHTENLQAAIGNADIVASATMTTDPVLNGDWVTQGTHIDLIGAYRADMREADDSLMRKARIFVDSRETTLTHIGELIAPIENGTITPDDIVADYYDIKKGIYKRGSASEITLFKNGGGAHLDLMVATAILEIWNNQA